ncbi:hypothetical protein PENSPDRAFT_756143 [Peniophora sp. CONT]|nr:hypothetical protein PENSPDRAFT_756143 [Peniophora sp. CONT]
MLAGPSRIIPGETDHVVMVHFFSGPLKNGTRRWAKCQKCARAKAREIHDREKAAREAAANDPENADRPPLEVRSQNDILFSLVASPGNFWSAEHGGLDADTDKLLKHIMSCMHHDDLTREKARRDLLGRQQSSAIRRLARAGGDTEMVGTAQSALNRVAQSVSSEGSADTTHGVKRRRTDVDEAPLPIGPNQRRPRLWPEAHQEMFAADLCRLLVMCNVAWWAVSLPFWVHFFEKYVPGADMPDRRELSGVILKAEVAKVLDKWKPDLKRRFAIGQCDGWKNVKRNSILGFMANVEFNVGPYLLNTHDISPEKKDAINLLKIVLAEIIYYTDELHLIVVGWCTDASGESAKMRKLLVRVCPWLIVLDCWAHQVNLVVGDIFKVHGPFIQVMDDALEVIKWFNNHGRAHGLLGQAMRKRLGREYSLVNPVLSRWTSLFHAADRLLRTRDAMLDVTINREELISCAGDKRDALEKADEVVSIIERKPWWLELTRTHAALHPLTIAAHVMQANDATISVLLLTILNLYRVYRDTRFDAELRNAVHASLELRWKKQRRGLFVLALILDPFIRTSAISSSHVYCTSDGLFDLITDVYKSVSGEPPNEEFLSTFSEYIHRTGRWSADGMRLSSATEEAAKKKTHVNILDIWRRRLPLPSEDDTDDSLPTRPPPIPPPGILDPDTPLPSPPSVPNGAHGFVWLACYIHAAVGNSAPTERMFSLFGIIHSKHRNRMDHAGVRDQAILKESTRADFPDRHAASHRKTQAFDDLDGPDDEAATTRRRNARPAFRAAADLTEIGESDNEADTDELLGNIIPSTAKMRRKCESNKRVLESAQSDPLSLSRLFKFPTEPVNGAQPSASTRYLLEFWNRGAAGVEEEGREEEELTRGGVDDV